MRLFGRRWGRRRHADYFMVACIWFLVIFGLAMLVSASSHLGKLKFDDTYFYLKHQVFYGLSFGIILYLIASKINYRSYKKVAFISLIISIVLLALVFTPLGTSSSTIATRWIKIGPVIFQPSEVVKIFFIIYLASWLSKRGERQHSFTKGFLPFLIVTGIIATLLLLQPSTSTVAILMATAVIMYFVSGAKLRYIGSIALLGTLAILLIAYTTPYRWERITSFLDNQSDVQESSFHINQALIAIGSGGLTGVGYGQSTTKVSYLPEPLGDSIFAVIAEELGFIGAGLVVLVFMLLMIRIFMLAYRARDKFGQLLMIGIGSLITIQAIVNIGAISGLLPLTGTPLPFISFGGTALASYLTLAGIAANISKYT